MKEIIEHYGQAILSVVATVMVFTLIFAPSSPIAFSKITRDGVKKEVIDTSETRKGKITGTERPSIKTRGDLHINRDYKAMELISGKGITYAKIVTVEDTKGESDFSGESICFKHSGIYRVSIYAEDNEGRHGTLDMYLGVND